jgi:hypothetical protein
MPDQNESPGFLGGGPKFNAVGKDNRSAGGPDAPLVPARRGWMQLSAGVLAVVLLAVLLYLLTSGGLGQTVVPLSHGGRAAPTDIPQTTADPNLK